MDLEVQKRIKELAEKHGAANLVVLLGANEAEGSGLALETVTAGDPAYAGSLAGVQLGVPCYHICEPLIKAELNPQVYEDQVSMMEMVIPIDAINAEMARLRGEFRDLIKA